MSRWQPIFLAAEEGSTSVLKGEFSVHTAASTAVCPLHHLDRLPLCRPPSLWEQRQGLNDLLPGTTSERKVSGTNYSPHCVSWSQATVSFPSYTLQTRIPDFSHLQSRWARRDFSGNHLGVKCILLYPLGGTAILSPSDDHDSLITHDNMVIPFFFC